MQKSVYLSDKNIEQLKELMEKKGFTKEVEMIRFCIAETHGREFKDYIAYRKPKVNQTSEEMGEREYAKKQKKEDMEKENKQEVCAELGGEVVTIGGKSMCRIFETDNFGKQHKKEVPLENVNRDMLG